MKFHGDKARTEFINNCKNECMGLSSDAKYIGCYEMHPDFLIRPTEFKTLLGENISPRECFKLAKEKEFKYAALETNFAGNDCYGNNEYKNNKRISDA